MAEETAPTPRPITVAVEVADLKAMLAKKELPKDTQRYYAKRVLLAEAREKINREFGD